MKKIFVALIMFIIVSSLTIFSIWAITSMDNENPPEDEISSDKIIEQSSQKVYSCKDLVLVKSADSYTPKGLAVTFKNFDSIIQENDYIEFENFFTIEWFSGTWQIEATQNEAQKITVSTEKATDSLKYLMFLATLKTNYPNSIVDYQIGYDDSFNLGKIPAWFISFDYKDYGYDTAAEYYSAITFGQAQIGQNTYLAFYDKQYICYYSDFVESWVSSPNLVPEILSLAD